MKKLVVILLVFTIISLMPPAPAFGQIVRPKKEQPTTPPPSGQSNRNSSQSTTRTRSTTRTTTRTRTTRTTRTRQTTNRTRGSYNRSRSSVREDNTPVIEVSFGCNVNDAIIIIEDEEYNVDDSCVLKEGPHLVEIEAEGYEDYSETIEVDEDNNYFYFELEEIPYEYVEPDEVPEPTMPYVEPEEPVVAPPAPAANQDMPEEWVTVKGITFSMVYVQGGTYTRYRLPEVGDLHPGSVPPAHQVTLSSYYIGKNEVTRGLWYAVMSDSVLKDHPKDPMSNVSWDDCQAFLVKLNNLTGKNFCLPTDAEWEFAARGGVKSRGYAFAGSNNIDEVAWHNGNSEMEFHEVGLKKPNELGIYDMTGSVWEWCSDWSWNWREDVDTSAPLVNPTGPETGKNRVARGGGLLTEDENCCVCRPDPTSPDTSSDELGFRLVLK